MIPQPADGKIKVVRVLARLNVGGPAIHVVNLHAGLDPTRFEQVLVVGTENPGEGSMLDYALSQGVTPFIIPEIAGDPWRPVLDTYEPSGVALRELHAGEAYEVRCRSLVLLTRPMAKVGR